MWVVWPEPKMAMSGALRRESMKISPPAPLEYSARLSLKTMPSPLEVDSTMRLPAPSMPITIWRKPS